MSKIKEALENKAFVINARDMTDSEKKLYKKGGK